MISLPIDARRHEFHDAHYIFKVTIEGPPSNSLGPAGGVGWPNVATFRLFAFVGGPVL